MEEDGKIIEECEMENNEESRNKFVVKYLLEMPGIALESSTTGKYVAKLLRNAGIEHSGKHKINIFKEV
ncbi:MAG: hypothetical protein QW258_02065 [Thermoplasmata archaeon]